MGFFSPYKRHANQFSYTPRYYDPEKEAREQRRAELRGERSDDTGEYTPGKYIRTQSEARQQSRAKRKSNVLGGSTRIISLVVVMLLVFLFVYVLVPRVGAIFEMATTAPAPVEKATDDFDPYAPLIIVPNDYVEGEELVDIE
ncbi:MAG: hypothetical protein E7131_03940 [Rikenellaceae bacterium]|nr:hypothetical protein [Rikenellaceae bacterium]